LLLFFFVNVPFVALALTRVSDIPERTLILINTIIFILQTVWVSLGVGTTAEIMEAYLRDETIGVLEGWRRLRQNLVVAVTAGMASSLLAIFIGQLFPPLLALVYGPPMLMQVIAVEGASSLRQAWGRTQQLMTGHWLRVISHLLTVVLGAFLIFNLAATLVISLAGDVSNDAEAAILTALIAAVAIFTYPFIATVQYVAFADVAAFEGTGIRTPQRARRNEPDTASIETTTPSPEDELPAVRTHYDVLGVRPYATQKQIRRAYERRMKLTDPERHAEIEPAESEKLAAVRSDSEAAYEVLSDPERRRAYDEELGS
jgi:hypothetical protein